MGLGQSSTSRETGVQGRETQARGLKDAVRFMDTGLTPPPAFAPGSQGLQALQLGWGERWNWGLGLRRQEAETTAVISALVRICSGLIVPGVFIYKSGSSESVADTLGCLLGRLKSLFKSLG